MEPDRMDVETDVTGNRTIVPARVRRELGIDDGDRLRWSVRDDDSVRVEVVDRDDGSFAEFAGYDDEGTAERDASGLE